MSGDTEENRSPSGKKEAATGKPDFAETRLWAKSETPTKD